MSRIKNYTAALISSFLLVIGFIYAARGLTDIYDKDTNIKTIIADGGLATLVSFIVVILLCELAIANTSVHKDIQEAKSAKGEILSIITPNLGKGHKFCEKRNEQERKNRKEIIIRKYFLDLSYYNDFLENGGLRNKDLSLWTKFSLWRMERKIKKINYDTYNFEEIINGVSKSELKKKKRTTLKGFRSKRYSRKILTSAATGIVFSYFGLTLAEKPNWGMVIYLAIQFITFIANGMTQYLFTKSYMLNDFRDQIKEDTNFLHEFEGSLILYPEWYIEEPKTVFKKGEAPNVEPLLNERLTNEPNQGLYGFGTLFLNDAKYK